MVDLLPTVEGVLGAAIARALALELAVRLLLGLGLFERGELALGQNETVLRDLRLERLEALLHGLEIVALPHAADAGRGDGVAALTDLVGYPDLAKAGCSNDSSTMIASTSSGVRFAK